MPGHASNLFANVFAMRDEDKDGQERHGGDFHLLQPAEKNGQWAEHERSHPAEGNIAEQREGREKNRQQPRTMKGSKASNAPTETATPLPP